MRVLLRARAWRLIAGSYHGVERLESRRLLSDTGTSDTTGADVVLFWNEVLTDALKSDQTLPGPTFASRSAAIVQTAVFDAANAITHAYAPFLADATALAGASIEAAVAAAASRALELIYPGQADTFAAALTESLAQIADGPAEDAGVSLGRAVAEQIVAARQDDGSAVSLPYTPGTEPGDWQPTPPGYTVALGADWGQVAPFTLDNVKDFAPPAPPELTSAQYTEAYNQVKELGAADSTTRTPEQTEIGIFWGYDRAGLGTPVALYNKVAATVAKAQGSTLMETARLLALGNLAMADAIITAWDAKYDHNFWRPITAIRNGDADGNPDTIGDPDWEPLGAPGGELGPNFTPPFPGYISGHAVMGGAIFETLRRFYGTDNVPFTLASEELPDITRSYNNFSEAQVENEVSRIYLGIHWPFDVTAGGAVGQAVADHVSDQFLTPQPQPVQSSAITGAQAVGPGTFSNVAINGISDTLPVVS